MQDLAIALALVLVVEGVIYALFPASMKQMMLKVQDIPEGNLRLAGLAAAAIGVVAVWLIRGVS